MKSPGRISAGEMVKEVIEMGTEVPTEVNVGKGVWSGVIGMGVGLRAGGKVVVGKSSAVGEGSDAAVAGNVEVRMGGGVSVVGTSTTTMQPVRPSTQGRSNQEILERGIGMKWISAFR